MKRAGHRSTTPASFHFCEASHLVLAIWCGGHGLRGWERGKQEELCYVRKIPIMQVERFRGSGLPHSLLLPSYTCHLKTC